MSLSSSPQQHTLVRVEARKSFAFAVEIFDAAGNLIDLADCALSLVVAKQPHRGGTVVLDVLAEMLENGQGRAQFMLQAADLDLAPGEYPFALVLITADEYSAVVAKGVFDVQGNVEADSANFTYDATQPAQTLTARILKDNKVQVRVDHLPYPALRIGSVQTVENYEDAGASVEGVYPLQLLHLTLPKGGVGEPGPAPEIEIGAVSIAGPGLPPSASITGSQLVKKLNLVLPQPMAYPLVAVPQGDGTLSMSSPIIVDNGDGTVSLDLEGTVTFASAEHTHSQDKIHDLPEDLDSLRDSVEAIRARVPDWEAGKTYPVDSVVQRLDILWRAKEVTDVAPGPETIEVNANDSTFFTNPLGAAGVVDEITAQVGNESAFYSKLIPADKLHGMKVTFELAYKRHGYGWDAYNQFGLFWGAGTPGWSTSNHLGMTGNDAMDSGTTFVPHELLFYRTGMSLAVDISVNGVFKRTAEFSGATSFLDARFRIITFGGALQVRNFRFQYGGGASTEWELLSHVGAVHYFRDLAGIPTVFPPADHDAARITSGTIAAARLPAASDTAAGAAMRATAAIAAAGTDITRYTTPYHLKQETDKVRTEMTALVNNTIVPITRADYNALPTPRPAGVVYVFKD